MPHALPLEKSKSSPLHGNVAIAEPPWVRYLLIGVTLAFLGLFLFVPLVAVFVQAFEKGWKVYFSSVIDTDALAAIRLTLLVAAISVPLNTFFGVAAAWAISKFEFWVDGNTVSGVVCIRICET